MKMVSEGRRLCRMGYLMAGTYLLLCIVLIRMSPSLPLAWKQQAFSLFAQFDLVPNFARISACWQERGDGPQQYVAAFSVFIPLVLFVLFVPAYVVLFKKISQELGHRHQLFSWHATAPQKYALALLGLAGLLFADCFVMLTASWGKMANSAFCLPGTGPASYSISLFLVMALSVGAAHVHCCKHSD